MSIGFVILLLVILTFVFILAGIPIYISLLFTGTQPGSSRSSTDTPIATIAVVNSIFTGVGNLPLWQFRSYAGR